MLQQTLWRRGWNRGIFDEAGAAGEPGDPRRCRHHLHVLIEVDPDKHAQHTDDIDFNAESKGEFHQDQVDRERRSEAGHEVRGEDVLNRALGRDGVEDFSKNSAKEPADNDKDEQNPR